MEIVLYAIGGLCCLALINMSKETTEFDFAMTIIVIVLSFGLASIISVLKEIREKIKRKKNDIL